MDAEFQQFISMIEPVDEDFARSYEEKLAASGQADTVLCHLAGRLAAIRGSERHDLLKKAVIIFAADHAVDGGKNESQGKNSKADALEIASGRGPINKVAHKVGAGVLLLDMGLQEDIPESPGVQVLKVMAGSHYYGNGPAMAEDEMLDALYSGIQIGQNLADEGYTAIGIGSLGERSILTAFILTAAFYRSQMPDLAGSLKEKNQMKMLGAVLRTHGLDCTRPLELLQKAGAPDVAAMVGCILSAAHRHVALVFDNAVTGAAVLIAQALQPAVMGYVFPSAAYAEPVHRMQMEYLHLNPVVSDPGKDDQAMGSVLGLSVLDAAVESMKED